jgi:hypothetical protein
MTFDMRGANAAIVASGDFVEREVPFAGTLQGLTLFGAGSLGIRVDKASISPVIRPTGANSITIPTLVNTNRLSNTRV